MASITAIANDFFAACETGKGWEACKAFHLGQCLAVPRFDRALACRPVHHAFPPCPADLPDHLLSTLGLSSVVDRRVGRTLLFFFHRHRDIGVRR